MTERLHVTDNEQRTADDTDRIRKHLVKIVSKFQLGPNYDLLTTILILLKRDIGVEKKKQRKETQNTKKVKKSKKRKSF